MKTEPKIYAKNGNLTAYGFSCGYIEQQTKLSQDIDAKYMRKEIYKEYNVYTVKAAINGNVSINESFYNLTEARKKYNSIYLNTYLGIAETKIK